MSGFPWDQERIGHLEARRVSERPAVDGRLSGEVWRDAAWSDRFRDLVSGRRTVHDTRVAVLWDDEHLYVGYRIEEPHVAATLTERDSLVWQDNDVELFIAGADAYYEFEINAFGTIYEVLFVWDDAYDPARYPEPELQRYHPQAEPFDGVGFPGHPRGMRTGFWGWDLPGLRTAVHVDGTLNDDTDRDRGWTVELAIPWASLDVVARADDRALPPREGDVWRMDFSRFNTYKEAPVDDGSDPEDPGDSGGWALSPHGVWDSHIPELFPYVHFSGR